MRAVTYSRSGPAAQVLRMVEIPDPEPEAGQVRVRIAYSGVNPTDWKRRAGEGPLYGGFQVPHQDGSGVIDLVGEGVGPERVGERVWVYHAAIGHAYGTAAQFVCLPERQAVPLPDNVSLAQGATLGIPYLTAAHALAYLPAIEGSHVLVQGGAGAVGFAAIQLGRHMNARIVTTVSGTEKADLARMARADVVLNYRSPEFSAGLAEAARGGFDLVTDVDLANNLSAYVDQLSLGAHIVAYASDGSSASIPVRLLMFRNASAHFFVVYLLPDDEVAAAVSTVRAMLASRAFISLPLHEYELGDVARAHDDVQRGIVGRALIRIE